MHHQQPAPGGIFLVIVSVIAIAFVASSGLDAGVAAAKRGGYGGDGGGKGYAKACKKGCKSARKTCLFCRKQDLEAAKNACKGQAKADYRQCRTTAKQTFKTLKNDCKSRTSGCSSCCRNSYGSDCQADFAGTPGHGTFFRRYCSGYGGNKTCRKEKPNCSVRGDDAGGGDSDGSNVKRCQLACEKQYRAALKICKQDKKGCDAGAIEAAYQQCLAACSPSSTGPPITTTTSLPPHDPCPALACDQYDNLCQDASCSTGDAFCTFHPKPPSTCDDGNACNGYEYLDCAVGCQAGGDPCPPSDLCTTWECTSINNSPSCIPTTLSVPTCDDGDACNGYEAFDCVQGVCRQGPPVFCSPGDHCVSENNNPRCES